MSNADSVEGEVTEVLPNLLHRIQLAEGQSIIGYISGRMRMNKIRVIVGDRVMVVLDQHGGKNTNRIIKRL